eukprot:m51a1_g11758 hypothetical protein (596) ;mRNA; f:209770-212117
MSRVQRPSTRQPSPAVTPASLRGATAVPAETPGKILLTCEICKKQYEDTTQFGLHVCPRCCDPTKALPGSKPHEPHRPKTLVCYVCGREFGTSSLAIHQAQCLKKRALQQAQLPPEQRTTLRAPTELVQSLTATADRFQQSQQVEDMDAYNELAYEAYKQTLVPCPLCGRKFSNESRLAVHMRGCKPGSSSKPVAASIRPTASSSSEAYSPSQQLSGSTRQQQLQSRERTPPSASLGQPPQRQQQQQQTAAAPKAQRAPMESAPPGRYDSIPAAVQARPASSSQMQRLPAEAMPAQQMQRAPAAVAVESAPPGRYEAPPVAASPARPLSSSSQAERAVAAGGTSQLPPDAFAPAQVPLGICKFCDRMFAEDRLAKHEKICASQKERKVFDASKKRLDGEALSMAQHTKVKEAKGSSAQGSAGGNTKWRREHEAFVAAIRNAKKMSTMSADEIRAMPPPPPEDNPDYVQCPHCMRKFNQKAAERHIAACANSRSRPKPPPSKPAASPARAQQSPARTLTGSNQKLSATMGGPVPAAARSSMSASASAMRSSGGLSSTMAGGNTRQPQPAANGGRLPISKTGSNDFCGTCGRMDSEC